MGSVSPNDAFWAKHDKYVMSTGVPACSVVITRAKGTRLYDGSGRSILDFTSGQSKYAPSPSTVAACMVRNLPGCTIPASVAGY